MENHGFPQEILLLFTVMIWVLYGLIYFSNPKNKMNQWCCIGGIILSIGVLKEYIYFSGITAGVEIMVLGMSYFLDEFLNSIMTAILYYLAMPCVMIFSFYFCHVDRLYPRLFQLLKLLIFFPVLIFCFVYPWSQTRQIPLTDPNAYVVVAWYNLIYGFLATIPIIWTLIKERNSYQFRQRRLVSVIALLPLWYWLITLFGFHLLGLKHLDKIWQGNAFILAGLFAYYIRNLFREGIWGMRLNKEYFDWSGETVPLSKNVQYVLHMMKGEIAKIGWCSQSIRLMDHREMEDELDIIDHSVMHMEEFIRQSRMYSEDILLNIENINVKELFEDIKTQTASKWKGKIVLEIEEEAAVLYCDLFHIREVLQNLVQNALDAMDESGTLRLSCCFSRKHIVLLRVSDTGKGILQQDIQRIFEPYYTSHSDSKHFGLGLSYCQNVIRAHNGYIQVESHTESRSHGTVITLCLPQKHRKRNRRGRDDQSLNSGRR